MLLRPSQIAFIYSAALFSLFSVSTFALELDHLRAAKNLTPQRFASYFRNFEYKFRKEVQRPEVFLASKSGDCDDFSTLAAAVLRSRGYTPRLVTVRMTGVNHVVCYIEETKSYLDYNNRNAGALVACENSLESIAASVAKSYNRNWFSVSEFTFDGHDKRLVQTASRKDTRMFASILR
ncbi:MAG TPA: transglutaminase-like domain-containing protein [Verrucomicrobiae bacterium]